MARERISRPDPTPGGREASRAATANKLASLLTGGRDRGETGARIDHLTGRSDRSARELISQLGGTSAAARSLGVHASTTRRWAAGKGMTSEHRAALNKAARRDTVTQFGGTQRVAELTGRSRRTVQQWVTHTTQAGPDAQHRLNKHETRQRHNAARTDAGLHAPLGTSKGISFRSGEAHVNINPGDDYPYDYDRIVHSNLPDEVIEDALALLAQGNQGGAHAVIERHLSYEYSNVDEYDPNNGLGFYLDSINESRGFELRDWRTDL